MRKKHIEQSIQLVGSDMPRLLSARAILQSLLNGYSYLWSMSTGPRCLQNMFIYKIVYKFVYYA